MRRARWIVLVGLLGAALSAGCTADEPAPTPSAQATQAASPTPTPTPTPTGAPDELGVVYDQSDPELGIVFEDVPEDLTGDAADVYNTLALYEVEYWRAMTTGEISPIVHAIGSERIVEIFERFTSNNTEAEAEIGGTFRTRISEVDVDGDSATATLCDRYGEATFATPEKEYTPAEAGFGDDVKRQAQLTRGASEGQWSLTKTTKAGTC